MLCCIHGSADGQVLHVCGFSDACAESGNKQKITTHLSILQFCVKQILIYGKTEVMNLHFKSGYISPQPYLINE